MAGVSVAQWQFYLAGKNKPAFSTIARFARAAGVSLAWLAYGEEHGSSAIDEELLGEIVDVIEEECARRGARPPAKRYAQLVAYCYREAAAVEGIARPDAAAIRRAFRLVS